MVRIKRSLLAGASAVTLALTALLSAATAAAAVPAETHNAVDSACVSSGLSAAEEYRQENNAASDATLYIVCVDEGEPAVFGVTPDGEQLAPGGPAVEEEEAEATPDETLGVDDQSLSNDSQPLGCFILSDYGVECRWHITYAKIDGQTGTTEWVRGVGMWARTYLQWRSFQVDMQGSHDQWIGFKGNVTSTINRMQGILPPTNEGEVEVTLESSVWPSSPDAHPWLTRESSTEGKFSINVDLTALYDNDEGVWIPIVDGDKSMPRFQCGWYTNQYFHEQCKYPNGQEAPVF